MSHSNNDIDADIWTVIDSYFKNTDNYLSKNQLDSYNTFININIPKTIRQFNPISFSKVPKSKNSDENKIDIEIYLGATFDKDTNEIINDGLGVYIGKPCIRELSINDNNEKVENKKILFPNEARLKNLNYETEILIDVFVKYTINDDSIPINKRVKIKSFEKVSLGKMPVMLQSKICSLYQSKKGTLRTLGECEYDQGGYFIITGKEKVLVAQERQVENKIYVNFNDDEKKGYKYDAEIRSAPENKFQPAYITRIRCLYPKKSTIGQTMSVAEDTLRVIIPKIQTQNSRGSNSDTEIPLFIVFRALGIISDKDILKLIITDFNNKLGEQMLDILRPTIIEGHQINNQIEALEYLQNRISKNHLRPERSMNDKRGVLFDILRNYFLPHIGTNFIQKAHFLGYMVNQVLLTRIGIKKSTDRDSYMYKRIDQSGFLISLIFRDLYFRVKNDLSETINKTYRRKDDEELGTHWLNPIFNENGEFNYDYEIHNLIGNIGDNFTIGETINNVVNSSIMTEGWNYAFKNCWGLKNAKGCKEEIVQDLGVSRISFVGFISHLRRINTPLSDSAKVREPHMLHATTWGIMCPPETPDGHSIGLRKNLAITAIITAGTNSNALLRALYNSTLESIMQVDFEKGYLTKVFLNERLVGYTRNPTYLYRKMKLLKRNALINIYTSISWYIEEMIIKISTDSGRAVRPIFVIGPNNTHPLTKEIINRLKDNDDPFNWLHLVGGTLKQNKQIPFEDTDPNYYYEPTLESDLDKLEKTAGIIEYTDKEEENTLLIAMTPSDLKNSNSIYTHCEIHPTLIFGAAALTTPNMEMNQAPRNQFSAGQGKQALGMYATNFRNRMDNKAQILHYPQRSIVKNKMEKYMFADDLPYGINAIVALGCFSGYNQDDSIIINKSSVERGLFHTTKFRTYDERDEVENGKITKQIMLVNEKTTRKIKDGNRSKLDENGLIKEGIKVNDNDIIVSKCEIIGEKDADGNEITEDVSIRLKLNEEGIVDKVYSNKGNDEQKYVKIRVRKHKIPELGDKFCARHGQKGTIGMLIKQIDLPVSKFGITPDMIINAQAFPSRMTIGQFLELLLGKAVCNIGYLTEVAPFSKINHENIADILEKSGFERYGNEVMYSGINGEQMKYEYFIGPTFYERLTHQVSDKYQSRDDGMRDALTLEPVGGRSQGGGMRLGEMERDAILSYGISSFLKESFMERSNKFKFYISNKSGLISAYNKEKGIYRDFIFDESKQYVDNDKQVFKRQIDSTDSIFSCVETPYAMKLFIQEMEAMGIAPRLITEKTSSKWESIKNMENIIINEDFDIYQLNNINNVSSKSSLYPYFQLINKLRENLISGTFSSGSLIDFNMIDGSDLIKWKKAGFNNIIAITDSVDKIDKNDNSINNIINKIKDDNLNNSSQSVSLLELKSWINNTKFNFMVDDIYSSISNINNINCDVATIFNNFESLFTSKKHIDNFFINARNSLSNDGFLLINALDGNKVFNLLKKLRGTQLEGKIYDNTTQKYINSWYIKPDKLNLANDLLNSDLDNFMNQTVNILYPGFENEINIPLIHPTTIITLAKKHGFDLLPSSQIKMLFRSINKSVGSFKDALNTILYTNNDEVLSSLRKDSNSDLLKFLELNNYFIFRVSTQNIIPNHVYKNTQVNSCLSDNLIISEPKYSKFKLPIQVSLDPTILKYRITEMRTLFGNVNNSKKINLDIASGYYNKYDISTFINDIDAKLSSDSFKLMGHENFKNSISYLFENIKLGIYVRFINSTLAIFAPMFNIDYDINNTKFENDTIDEINIDNNGKINSWTQNINVKLDSSNKINDVLSFLNNRYSSNFTKDDLNDKLKTIYLDGCRVFFGNDYINKYAQDFVYLRHMFETLSLDKENQINDCEFIINVLNHPIYNVKNNKLYNPFTVSIGTDLVNLSTNTKLLPVLSMNEKKDFLDISIPTPYQWKLAINSILPPDCSPHYFLNEKSSKLEKVISINFGLKGCNSKSDRALFLNNIDSIRKKLDKSIGVSLHYGSDEYDTEIFNDVIQDNTITFNPSITYINEKANNNAQFNLYIDGFGSDDYLTRAIFLDGTLIRLQNLNPTPFWYEKFLIPYNFKKSLKENKDADYILIHDLDDDFISKIKILIEEPDISNLVRNNLKNKRDTLFTTEFINNYLQYILNSINNCIGPIDKFVPLDIFKDIIEDPIDRQIIEVRNDNIASLIGGIHKKIKYIENITDTTINFNNEIIYKKDIEYQLISIYGPKSGVKKALEQFNEINNLENRIIKIKKESMNKVIGDKGKNIKKAVIDYGVNVYYTIKSGEILERLTELEINSDEVNNYKFIKIIGQKDNVDYAIDYFNSLLTDKNIKTKFISNKPTLLSIDEPSNDLINYISKPNLPYQQIDKDDDDIIFDDFMGGVRKNKKIYESIEKFGIIVIKYNKTNINNDKFSKLFDAYINKLNKVINEYINDNYPLISFEIITIDSDKIQNLTINLINKLNIPNELINFNNDKTNYLKCNKGVLFNYGALLAKELGCKWIVFQTPFLIPNEILISKYFEKPSNYSLNLLSAIYEPYLNNKRLGVFSINIDLFFKVGGYPNHLWNYDMCDEVFINRLMNYNINIKPLINFSQKYYFEDLLIEYHNIDKNTALTNIEITNYNLTSFSNINQLNKIESIKLEDNIYKVVPELKPFMIPLTSIILIMDKYKQLNKNEFNWKEFKEEFILDIDDYYSGIFKSTKLNKTNNTISIETDIINILYDIIDYQMNMLYEECFTLPFMNNNEFSELLQKNKIKITKNKNSIFINI